MYKNRSALYNFDFTGSFLTWLAMTFVVKQFLSWGDWIGFAAGMMQWAFWLFVILFKIKSFNFSEWKRERWHKKVLEEIDRKLEEEN